METRVLKPQVDVTTLYGCELEAEEVEMMEQQK